MHFDVDVSDLDAVDVPHPNALPWEEAVEILRVFVASSHCAGLVVTEFNPRRDASGSRRGQLVSGLVKPFGEN